MKEDKEFKFILDTKMLNKGFVFDFNINYKLIFNFKYYFTYSLPSLLFIV